jgi:hypothetical protein
MKLLQKNYHILLILCLVSITIIYFITHKTNNKQTSKNHSVPIEASRELTVQEYAVARNEYVNLLNNQNPRVALDKLREDTKTNSSLLRSCHALTHELGHEAYEKYKDFGEALKYQDEICNSGYLHGIIEAHFSESNDIFATLQSVCNKYAVESFIGWECYHGVGHGLMYYTSNDLPKSISLCETYRNDFAASSCVNGVFMENFNSDQKLHTSRFLKASNPFYPCEEQKDSHKADCYFYAPTYYLTLNKNDYIGALKWCKTAEQKFQSTCANGIGSEAIKENINNPKLVEEVCMNADRNQVSSCISGMVGLYINHFGSMQPARELCNILKKSNQSLCKQIVESRAQLFQI